MGASPSGGGKMVYLFSFLTAPKRETFSGVITPKEPSN
jgi:hypothetical protein